MQDTGADWITTLTNEGRDIQSKFKLLEHAEKNNDFCYIRYVIAADIFDVFQCNVSVC